MKFSPSDGPTLIFLGMFVIAISLTSAFVGLDMLGRILAIVGLLLSAFGVWPELSYRGSNGLAPSRKGPDK